jgi:hypothetical protein
MSWRSSGRPAGWLYSLIPLGGATQAFDDELAPDAFRKAARVGAAEHEVGCEAGLGRTMQAGQAAAAIGQRQVQRAVFGAAAQIVDAVRRADQGVRQRLRDEGADRTLGVQIALRDQFLVGGGDRVARYADLSPEVARRRHRCAGRQQVVLDQRAHLRDDLRLQRAVQGRVYEDGKVHGVSSHGDVPATVGSPAFREINSRPRANRQRSIARSISKEAGRRFTTARKMREARHATGARQRGRQT